MKPTTLFKLINLGLKIFALCKGYKGVSNIIISKFRCVDVVTWESPFQGGPLGKVV